MKIIRFEDILSWQKGQDLVVIIYGMCHSINDADYCQQIKSAGVSISSNIAEGFERSSDADFVRMLYIAKGSAGEVRSLIHLGVRLHFITEHQKQDLLDRCHEIARLITALIKSISNKGRGRGTSLHDNPHLPTND